MIWNESDICAGSTSAQGPQFQGSTVHVLLVRMLREVYREYQRELLYPSCMSDIQSSQGIDEQTESEHFSQVWGNFGLFVMDIRVSFSSDTQIS